MVGRSQTGLTTLISLPIWPLTQMEIYFFLAMWMVELLLSMIEDRERR